MCERLLTWCMQARQEQRVAQAIIRRQASRSAEALTLEQVEDVVTTLLSNQEMVALHVLWERCVAKDNPDWDSVVGAVAEYTHRRILAQPTLLRALITQGFDPVLLAPFVARVDGVHICLHYLPALLRAASPMQQVFLTKLAALVAVKHRVPQALEVLRLAMGDLALPVRQLREDACLHAVHELVGALQAMVKAFPKLAASCIDAVVKVGPWTGHTAGSCVLAHGVG